MASPTLSPFKSDTVQTTYALQSTSASKTRWVVTGRSLAKPYYVEVERKFAPNNSAANDHIILRVSATEQSTLSPYKNCTVAVSLDISIPRDQTGCTTTVILEQVSTLCSLLRMQTAMSTSNGSNTGINALISGSDL